MSGHWPPSWYDPDDDLPVEAGEPGTDAEAGLSEVAAYLASVPVPPMPGSVEARISAALAVEAASRAGLATRADGTVQEQRTAPGAETAGPRVLGAVPAPAARARARVLPRGPRGQRGSHGGRDRRAALGRFVYAPLVVCLLLAGIGFGLSRVGGPSSSSSSANSAAAPMASAAASSAAGSAAAGSSRFAGSRAAASSGAAVPAAAGSAAPFVVTESGTRYQQATLAQQARAQLHAAQARGSVPSAAPSAQLRACVLNVTGGVLPGLVDQATYQGTPAYVIASTSRVWVVGLGCTGTKPEVITSLPLAG